MKPTIFLVLSFLATGCTQMLIPGQRNYPGQKIGIINNGQPTSTELWIVTVEGKRYYATTSAGPRLVLGSEVPKDAWDRIAKRLLLQDEPDEGLIQLVEN